MPDHETVIIGQSIKRDRCPRKSHRRGELTPAILISKGNYGSKSNSVSAHMRRVLHVDSS